jgi:hypothetical protein
MQMNDAWLLLLHLYIVITCSYECLRSIFHSLICFSFSAVDETCARVHFHVPDVEGAQWPQCVSHYDDYLGIVICNKLLPDIPSNVQGKACIF